MFRRYLKLNHIVSTKSAFLFGPRQTGKTTLIRNQLPSLPVIDLLKSETYLQLQRAPQMLRTLLPPSSKQIVIDEIQRIPELLNEVHYLIENQNLVFLLTGSSARKLRRKGVNLLGGRARNYHLFPLTYYELKESFLLEQSLVRGSMPSIVLSDDAKADLLSYVENYMQLEIATEALTRNIPAFSRFLEIAALSNTKILNYSKIASDAQIAPSTAQEYFQILRDTLMGFDLPVWKQQKKRKLSKTSKFYFFDVGVVNAVLNRWHLHCDSVEFGENLEALIFSELKAFSSYNNYPSLYYWRTLEGDEVDFIFNQEIAIEVKSKRTISNRELKGLMKLKREEKFKRYITVARVSSRTWHNGFEVWPVEDFLKALWSGEF